MPEPTTYGPYDDERQTQDSPLLRDIADVIPDRGAHTALNRQALARACYRADVKLGAHDLRIVGWLAGYESSTVQVVIGLISRAYAAGLAKGGQAGVVVERDEAGPGTRRQVCFIARCDECGDDYEQDYTPHWPSSAEAVSEAVGDDEWWTDGTTLLCSGCRIKPHAVVPDKTDPEGCARCWNPAEEHEMAGEPS